MLFKLIRLTILCYVFVLLLDVSFVVCEENTTKSSVDNGSGGRETSDVTKPEEKATDDYVYEYGSGETPKKLDTNSREERLLNGDKDDYVYDYGSGGGENTTKISDTLELSNRDFNISTTESSGNISTTEIVSTESSVNTSDDSVSDDESHGSDSNVTDSSNADYDDYSDGEGGGEGSCKQETLLTKVRNLHDEGRNETINKHVQHINQTFERLNYVRDVFHKLFGPDKGFAAEFLGLVGSIDVILSPECFASFFTAITAFRNNDLWAQKFFDSSGRYYESGSADGKFSSFGEYDECLDLESPDKDNKGFIIKGQYCLLNMIVPFPSIDSYKKGDPIHYTFDDEVRKYAKSVKVENATTVTKFIEVLNLFNGTSHRIGFCIPHLCKRHEFDQFINKLTYPITRMPIDVGKCETRDKSDDFTVLQLISMSVLVILTILVITSTGIEVYNIIYEQTINEDNNNLGDVKFGEDEPLKVNPYYYTFSLVTNTRALITKKNRFTPVDTLRLFVILHIYILHFYNILASLGYVTLKRVFTTYPILVLSHDKYSTLRNSLSFDALFVMSGFILANSLLGKLEKSGGKFNYINYFVNRWLRFSVPLLGSIIFIYILPVLGHGPIWEYGMNWINKGCESPLTVLFGFLFISNFNEQLGIMNRQPALPYCNPSTWFISVLFQLHIIVPIFIYIYFKNPKHGLYATISAIVLGLIMSVAPAFFGILPESLFLQMESFEEIIRSFVWYNLSTNVYIASFLIGVIGGYILRLNIKLNIEHEVILWILSILSILLVFMWNNTFWRMDRSAPIHSVLLWYSFGKLLFSTAFTWICFALCTGRAQTLSTLLSWTNFQPFSRLSFAFFMIHYMSIFRRIFTVKDTILMTDTLMMENSIIDFIYTFILAYIFYALIESPFSNIMALWLRPKTTVDQHKNGVLSNRDNDNNRDFGHSNDIELDENIGHNNDVNLDIPPEKTIKI